MKSITREFNKLLYAVYRVLWRGWILWILYTVVLVLSEANQSSYLIYPGIILLLIPVLVFREYRKPSPMSFGIYGDSMASFTTVAAAACFIFSWLAGRWMHLSGYHFNIYVLAFGLVALALVYFLRPRKAS